MFLLLSKCAQEKNEYFLFDVSYNLLPALFCLITLFESVLYTTNLREIIKSIYCFIFFLVTDLKTWNQLIYIDHTSLACVIIPGFTIDEKDLWLMLYTKYIVKRRSFEWKITAERWIVFGESSTSGKTHRVSFGSDEVLPSCFCYDWEKRLMLCKHIINGCYDIF